jgi:hypothetical protein
VLLKSKEFLHMSSPLEQELLTLQEHKSSPLGQEFLTLQEHMSSPLEVVNSSAPEE